MLLTHALRASLAGHSGSGFTWTASTSPTTNGIGKIIWAGTQFVALARIYRVITSPDGITWTNRTSSGAGVGWNALAWDGAVNFTAASAIIKTSTDNGISWSTVTYPLGGAYILDIIWANGQFVGVGDSSSVATSPDGVTWTVRNSGGNGLNSVAYNGSNLLVAVGLAGRIITSSDGMAWTGRTGASSQSQEKVIWAGNQFISIASSNIQTSVNGISWTLRTVPVTGILLQDIIWTGSLLVVVGNSGTILTSSDGISWTSRNSGTSVTLRNIEWSGSEFVVVGNSGTILSSTDGITWTINNSGTTVALSDVAWNGSKFCITGDSGTILTSS